MTLTQCTLYIIQLFRFGFRHLGIDYLQDAVEMDVAAVLDDSDTLEALATHDERPKPTDAGLGPGADGQEIEYG